MPCDATGTGDFTTGAVDIAQFLDTSGNPNGLPTSSRRCRRSNGTSPAPASAPPRDQRGRRADARRGRDPRCRPGADRRQRVTGRRRTCRRGARCRRRASRSASLGRTPVVADVARDRRRRLPGFALEHEHVGQRHGVAFHPVDARHARDPPHTVAIAVDVHEEVDRRRRLLPDGAHRQVEPGHEHHGLDPGRVASRGELACSVESDPSWPVFMAWSMSSASAPRTSPTTMRSGRMRSALRRRSRSSTSPLPSMLAGRLSSRITWRCWSRSSAASSMVTMRSSAGIIDDSTLSSVVLPRAGAAADEDVHAAAARRRRGSRRPGRSASRAA